MKVFCFTCSWRLRTLLDVRNHPLAHTDYQCIHDGGQSKTFTSKAEMLSHVMVCCKEQLEERKTRSLEKGREARRKRDQDKDSGPRNESMSGRGQKRKRDEGSQSANSTEITTSGFSPCLQPHVKVTPLYDEVEPKTVKQDRGTEKVGVQIPESWQPHVYPQMPRNSTWTFIPEAQDRRRVLGRLESHIHSEEELRNHGFQLHKPPSLHHPWMGTTDIQSSNAKRAAIVLDCEFMQDDTNTRQLSRVAAIDALTSETLLDVLVNPETANDYWEREKTLPIRANMDPAVATGPVLSGVYGALVVLSEFIDADTIIMGHAVASDLKYLRLTHRKIIDSQIQAANAVRKKKFTPGLQLLCKELCGIEIQVGKKRHHSPVEDSLATREVILAFTLEKKKAKKWADGQRKLIKHKGLNGSFKETKKSKLKSHAQLMEEHTIQKVEKNRLRREAYEAKKKAKAEGKNGATASEAAVVEG